MEIETGNGDSRTISWLAHKNIKSYKLSYTDMFRTDMWWIANEIHKPHLMRFGQVLWNVLSHDLYDPSFYAFSQHVGFYTIWCKNVRNVIA